MRINIGYPKKLKAGEKSVLLEMINGGDFQGWQATGPPNTDLGHGQKMAQSIEAKQM